MIVLPFEQIDLWAKLMPPIGISSRAKLAWRRFAIVELENKLVAFPAKMAASWMKSTGAKSMNFDTRFAGTAQGISVRGECGKSQINLKVYANSVPCETPFDPVAKSAYNLGSGPIRDRCEIAEMVNGEALSSTKDERKAEAKKKRMKAAARKVREAKTALNRATEEANEAQAVIDKMSLADAIAFAKRCRDARRLYRAAMGRPKNAPAWLPKTYPSLSLRTDEDGNYEGEYDIQTFPAYLEYVAALSEAEKAATEYKPRLHWPSYAADLARKANMSLAAWKKANADYSHKVYGPAFDRLKETEGRALTALINFIENRFGEYLEAQNLPKCLGSKWFSGSYSEHRPYSRARLILRAWPAIKLDLESQLNEAALAFEKASK